MLKQVLIVRQDLKLPKGKMAAQCAHASVDATLKGLGSKTKLELVKKWRQSGMAKIVVKVENEKELYKYIQLGKDQGILNSIISDAGKTTVAPGTVTCGALGPDEEEKINSITRELKLI
jgi:peptidyl-tRNA hydrolase, PTH2 family